MYCSNCGKKLEDNAKFCPACGASLIKPSKSEGNPDDGIFTPPKPLDMLSWHPKTEQPTKALVMEGIGLLFFIYLIIVNGTGDFLDQIWLEEKGPAVFLIGLVFLVISHFMFKRYKKKHALYGFGYAGYIVSCIAAVLLAVMLVMSIFMVISFKLQHP